MKWLVPETQKVVSFLQDQLGADISGKAIRRMLEANLCRVNGKIERYGSSTVKRGDRIELSPAWKTLTKSKPTPNVLYQDDHFIIVDKPTDWICDDKNTFRTFGPKHNLVHRLDKDTTGLLILAKNLQVKEAFIPLFQKKEMGKQYLCLVDGVPRQHEGHCESTIKNQLAITDWKLLATGKNGSLIQCQPITGRTHQIRIHMAEMGHPILVDPQYARTFRCSLSSSAPCSTPPVSNLPILSPASRSPLAVLYPMTSAKQRVNWESSYNSFPEEEPLLSGKSGFISTTIIFAPVPLSPSIQASPSRNLGFLIKVL